MQAYKVIDSNFEKLSTNILDVKEELSVIIMKNTESSFLSQINPFDLPKANLPCANLAIVNSLLGNKF